MNQKELIYLGLTTAKGRITQLGLSKKLGISLSTANNAIKPLKEIGAVDTSRRSIKILNYEKILMHWANCRNLQKDVTYETHVAEPATQIEKEMPPGIAFTAYSGYRFRYKTAPADYSEVIIYAEPRDLDEIKARFPRRKGPINLTVLKMEKELRGHVKKNVVPAPLIFVDLWNLPEWYAKDFIAALRKELFK